VQLLPQQHQQTNIYVGAFHPSQHLAPREFWD
jgi:hypothetical protein